MFAAVSVEAGGPLGVCNQMPIKYSGAGTVNLNYDGGGGNLGSRTKAQADAIVTSAVSLWTNVGTSTVTVGRGADLPVDVTAANYNTYLFNFSDGLNPVIYDTDGSIIDTVFGAGNKSFVLGFAGSAWSGCQYVEGRAVINGFISISTTAMTVVIAHEVGHLIGLDHTQLDNSQGLSSSNYPLMYPIANRSTVSLHGDDVAAVSALYPDVTLSSVYGQLTGTFIQANGTPIRGANLWARETATNMVYSIVSDYLLQNTGYFKLLLPAGTYRLHAEAVESDFEGGSSVGPYSECFPSTAGCPSPSFLPPLYSGSTPMAPVTLGNATPTQIVITAGCAATATFKLDGTGLVGGNCSPVNVPGAPIIIAATPGNGQASIAFTPPVSNGGSPITSYTATCNAGGFFATGPASPITVTGLANGTAYSCSVTATNAAGTGPASSSVNTTPLGPPGAPIIIAATPGNGQASIAFTPPVSNGGSPITSYTATCNPGGFFATGPASPLAVSGLTNGTTYTCSVSATNAVGASPASVGMTVMPKVIVPPTPAAYADLVFTALTPCRLYDSRPGQGGSGTWLAGTIRTVNVGPNATYAFQGGSGTDCGLLAGMVTGEIAAILASVSTVNQAAAGYLTFFPTGTANPFPYGVSQSYQSGPVQTSFVVMPTDVSPPVFVSGFTSAQTNVIVDVVGYFAQAKAAALECLTPTAGITTAVAAGSTSAFIYSDSCAAGYTSAGGSCSSSSSNMYLMASGASSDNTKHYCQYRNDDAGSQNATATNKCCRTTGR